jgi:hypothetical protein
MDMDFEALLAMTEVPKELIPHKVPGNDRPLTYEDLVSLLDKVYESPYGAPDVFEESRRTVCVNDTDGDGDCASCARYGDESPCRQRETRGQAKTRVMLEHYALEGRPARHADMWALRAQYVSMKEYVQSDGRPYSTHNPAHFTNRYGMGGTRIPVIQLGVYKGTPEAMMRYEAAENGARLALRLLS